MYASGAELRIKRMKAVGIGGRTVWTLLLRMWKRRDPAAMPCVIPEVVQLHEFNVIVGEHHVDRTGKHMAAGIFNGSRRRGRGKIVVPIDQTKAHAMDAVGSIAGVTVVKVGRMHGGICFQRENVKPDRILKKRGRGRRRKLRLLVIEKLGQRIHRRVIHRKPAVDGVAPRYVGRLGSRAELRT